MAVPAGVGQRPLPDRRFLTAVQRQMDAVRPIGIQVKVVPPVYVEIEADVILRGGTKDAEDQLRERLSCWLTEAGIGGTLHAGEAWTLAQALPGVLQVRRLTLRAVSPGCYQTEEGDIRLPPRAIPWLGRLRVEQTPERGGAR